MVRGSLSQGEFAKRLGTHRNTLARYERGERNPDAKFLADLCREFGVNARWLLTGQGPMYIAEMGRDDNVVRFSEAAAPYGGQPTSPLLTRLDEIERRFDLTPEEMARRLRLDLDYYTQVKAGKQPINNGLLRGLLAILGVDLNWFLSGEGDMLVPAALATGPAESSPDRPGQPKDYSLLTQVIEAVEHALLARNVTKFPPEKKSQLIVLMYDYCRATGRVDDETVERFLALVW